MKQISVYIEEEAHRQLKAKLAAQGKDISEWLREKVQDYLEARQVE